MILGFTGTRRGLTQPQRAALPSILATLPERVLYGGAVGADEEFHAFIMDVILDPHSTYPAGRVEIEVYPAIGRRWNDPHDWVVVHKALPPLERNRIIAERCDHLLACPAEPTEQQRGGTWSTVRYARKAGKPVTVINPDGSVVEKRR